MTENFSFLWQDYRQNIEMMRRIVSDTKDRVPKKWKKKICVKAVDVFGWESEVIKEM